MFLVQKLHQVVAATPLKLAMVFNGQPLTYGSFWRFIAGTRQSLAPHLPRRGIVLLWVDSILEGVILDLALRSLGLDTAALRTGDQVGLFAQSDVVAVITLASEGKAVQPPPGVLHLTLSDPSKQALDIGAPFPPLPEDLGAGGHVNLTSGTTGIYKKVLRNFGSGPGPIEQRRQRYLELGPGFRQLGEDTVVNVFNMGQWSSGGYTWPLLVWGLGGAVVFQQTDDYERALDWPGITHTLATPQYLNHLRALPEGAFPYLPDMQLIVVSGALSPDLARQIMRRLTPRVLVNLSSTEGGGWARTLIETEEDLRWYRLDPTRQVEIVDDAGVVLPPGELGRVRVSLREDNARSYLDDPAASASFFDDQWFYPGDLGVLDGKGRLALYGRTSDIVHIDGVKYPAEPWERDIQTRLECDGVCVLSGNWETGAEQLHVFIESRRPIPQALLETTVRETVGGFGMVRVHVLDALPRTGTGKIRRMALAQALHEGAQALAAASAEG